MSRLVWPANAALGTRVAAARRARRWSQRDLAVAFGAALSRPIDPTMITRLEQGKRAVLAHELPALAHVLDVRLDSLLSGLPDAVAAAQQ